MGASYGFERSASRNFATSVEFYLVSWINRRCGNGVEGRRVTALLPHVSAQPSPHRAGAFPRTRRSELDFAWVCAGVPFLPRHCSSGSSLLMGLVMRPTAACLGFTWNIEF